MAIIKFKDKIFHAEPQWEEMLAPTDFTSTPQAWIYKYYINEVEVAKEHFDSEYKKMLWMYEI